MYGLGNSLIILWKKNINGEEATFYNIKTDIVSILMKANILQREEKR